MFDPESKKTLILCRLSDMNRKADPSGQSQCFGLGLSFVRLGAGPLVSQLRFILVILGVCYHARTVSALEASSDKLSWFSSNGTCLSSHQILFENIKQFCQYWDLNTGPYVKPSKLDFCISGSPLLAVFTPCRGIPLYQGQLMERLSRDQRLYLVWS